MNQRFVDIPKHDWSALRLHPGFKKRIKREALERDISAEERLHQLLEFAYGDPDSSPRARNLESAHTS